MSIINYAKRQIDLKLVYYGPGLAGKTTSIQHIYQNTSPERRTQLVSLATDTERSLSFDFQPLALALPIRGFQPRLHLFTVPGPIYNDPARKLILRGVDGLIFVADSQDARAETNVESLEELESNLAIRGLDFDTVPIVFQYNKRDLPNVLPVAVMDTMLNPDGRTRFESVAARGVGVFEALEAVAKLMVEELDRG
jgi:signal recognition particle receptor subunit beta